MNKENCEIYFFGYPDISVEEKLKEIRTFDTELDWTSKKSDEVVLKHIKSYIEISKWLEKECQKYDLPFINVSKNREKIIDEFVEKILS